MVVYLLSTVGIKRYRSEIFKVSMLIFVETHRCAEFNHLCWVTTLYICVCSYKKELYKIHSNAKKIDQ